ncbi:hypothetical protein MVEG_08176 [Podila verticillata NRRL 6337]|nr:hypothetical protein MVEG_08176 [Podila verticillata NRRL 6337]
MDSLDSSPSTQTLNELLGSIAEHKQLDDEHLMALMHLCGQQGDLATTSLMNALRLVDIPNAVEKLVANRCQRSYYKVKDLASDLTFTCRPSQRHCTCDRFVHVLMDAIMCEHVLAALLAETLGTARQVPIDDVDFAEHS